MLTRFYSVGFWISSLPSENLILSTARPTASIYFVFCSIIFLGSSHSGILVRLYKALTSSPELYFTLPLLHSQASILSRSFCLQNYDRFSKLSFININYFVSLDRVSAIFKNWLRLIFSEIGLFWEFFLELIGQSDFEELAFNLLSDPRLLLYDFY